MRCSHLALCNDKQREAANCVRYFCRRLLSMVCKRLMDTGQWGIKRCCTCVDLELSHIVL